MDFFSPLILGLVGSVHCSGMCGPLALALPQSGKSPVAFFASRVAYNLGRVITYSLLGLVFGMLGGTLALAGLQRWVSITLGALVLAALLFSRSLSLWRPITALVERLKSRVSILLRRRSFLSLVLLGLLNGLLPCGLVYVAAAGATAVGSILGGVQYMATFGAGTIPVMLTISVFGKLIPFSLRIRLGKAIPVTAVALAALLILRGLALGIPWLSPDVLAKTSCCHP